MCPQFFSSALGRPDPPGQGDRVSSTPSALSMLVARGSPEVGHTLGMSGASPAWTDDPENATIRSERPTWRALSSHPPAADSDRDYVLANSSGSQSQCAGYRTHEGSTRFRGIDPARPARVLDVRSCARCEPAPPPHEQIRILSSACQSSAENQVPTVELLAARARSSESLVPATKASRNATTIE